MGPCLLGQEEEEDYARTLLTRWSTTRNAVYYVLREVLVRVGFGFRVEGHLKHILVDWVE
jgi:hypothetical protein